MPIASISPLRSRIFSGLRAPRKRLTAALLGPALIAATTVTLVQAPTASAATTWPSACTISADFNVSVTASSANLRTGPGTSYTSKGMLYRGDDARSVCMVPKSGGTIWLYIKLTTRSQSGLAKGTLGWIRYDLIQ
ncbi:hypothetical protein GCM10010358_80050 [Streptomyces minutiscleroticus]|uniref:SH3b domain-containing protein n=1 Tax=Streptomyces minutiscleroticus TaxID=68238 RepID=A0A918U9Z0_9ACTN|nr:SH3 domain-containing protein [Streptomyces minutiscleroticus]GGY16303.1 hypothetical protein GCM10010358_80050 [Streptomyces minutiscleroticus]